MDINRVDKKESKDVERLRNILGQEFKDNISKKVSIQQIINSAALNLYDNQNKQYSLHKQMNITPEQFSAVIYDIIKGLT